MNRKMNNHTKWYLIFYVSVWFFMCESAEDGPKILSINGNLILKGVEDKNISFETDEDCSLLIHGTDFSSAMPLMTRLDNAMENYKTILWNSSLKAVQTYSLITKPNGILMRLQMSENSSYYLLHSLKKKTILNIFKNEVAQLQSSVKQLKKMLFKNNCLKSPCKNGGSCMNIFEGVFCKCPDGWQGPLCEKDVDECSRLNSTDLGCQNGGVCKNLPGSYSCSCINGWSGIHCNTKSTDCNSGSASEICGHGICIPQNTLTGKTCLCDQGWRQSSDGGACTEDVDECKEDHPHCSRNPLVLCENAPGSFRCGACPAGYTGNGFYCADINECDLFNGGCSMNPLVECENTLGSRICGPCPPGYIGNGIVCSFLGICKINNGNCHHLAKCLEFPTISPTYIECRCPEGFSGNGVGPMGCMPSTSPCQHNPCHNGKCIADTNLIEGYLCRCSRGFYGKHCENTDGMCSTNPCQNGGTCVNHNTTSYMCLCPQQYSGHDCGIILQDCGGIFGLMEEGNITYPQAYNVLPSNDRTCSWQFETEMQKIFNISIEMLNLGNNECKDQWIEIFDGKTTEDESLGKFCGTKVPKNKFLLTTQNQVLINLHKKGRNGAFKLKWKSLKPQCHEILTLTSGSTGSVLSPNSPLKYPINRDCYWYMRAPNGYLISLTFFSFNIGNDTDCTGDFIKISSSFVQGFDTSTKICGGPVPRPLQSDGPELLIHFHSDERNSYSGFEIKYTVKHGYYGCGTTYRSSRGVISSPRYYFPRKRTCFYLIENNSDLKKKLSFTALSTSKSFGCLKQYVALYEGTNSSCPLIGRYCGKKLPATEITMTGNILVKLRSTDTLAYFSLTYETVCGGVFEAPSGFIQSEGYPNSYSHGLSCIYLIRQPPETTILLEIQDMDFEDYNYDDEECLFDFIEVRDGDNENSTLIGNFCDQTDDGPIMSSTNNLWIKFVTDNSDSGKGFRIKYSTKNLEDLGCGGVLLKKSGLISYDSRQSGRKNCKWFLKAPLGSFIQISWTNFIFPLSRLCISDHVNVYTNSSNSKDSVPTGTYCGNSLPPTLTISSNIASISVVKVSRNTAAEFSAYYVFLNETAVCGGNYVSETGTLKSPNYPLSCPPNSECIWTITVPKNKKIVLSTVKFRIGYRHGRCRGSFLEIRNGGAGDSPLIGIFCWTTIPRTIISHTNQLYLKLVSYYSVSQFMFTWTTSTGCGGTLTSVTGSMVSPNYPEPYHRNSDCFWKILVNKGSVVQLVFIDLDLEGKEHSSCFADYIQIFDGPSKLGKPLGKYCGSSIPPILTSTSNQVEVYFQSDISIQNRGFNLRYQTLCNNSLTGFGGVIESPNFPEPNPVAEDCYWSISVPKMNKINITFSYFDLSELNTYMFVSYTSRTKALHNYIEISYKIGNEAEEVQKLEGGKLLNTTMIHLTTDHAVIHFRSETNLVGNGFRLEWVLDGCGAHLRNEGQIKSPNYPKTYPNGIVCEWLIEAPIGYSIAINFSFVDVEKEENCFYDGIYVFNGPDSNSTKLGFLCHIDHPVQYISNGHLMFVRFESDSSFAGSGFISDFKFLRSKCGGSLTAPNGNITSPNYPRNYDLGDRCEWLITTEENHVINLKFEDLDLPSSPRICLSTFVKIYDGSSTSNLLLKKICGNKAHNEIYTSSTNQMFIVFRGDNRPTSLGFRAKYYKACGARIVLGYKISGNLKLHPLSISTSEENLNCSWTLVASPGQRVALTITHMRFFNRFDFTGVTVYNGETNKSPLLKHFQDNPRIPPTIISNGMSLHVVVDRRIDFFATYEIFGSNCGGTLTGLNGMFSTPDYPNTFSLGIGCEWTLSVAPGNEISVSFQTFDIPFSEKCNLDFLEIRKNNASGKLLGVFCGDSKPNNITNQGSLWIFFKTMNSSDSSAPSLPKRFLAEYTTSTHVLVTGYSGLIASPLYPEKFTSTDSFSWEIRLKYNRARILLEFKDLSIESVDEDLCLTASVMIYDGATEDSPLLGSYCGTEIPKPIESSSNNVRIQVELDSVRFNNKFLIHWSQIYYRKRNESCGSTEVIDISGIHESNITSPGYPIGYPLKSHCEWTFGTTSANSLRINFTDLRIHVGSLHSCYPDVIHIYSNDKHMNYVCNPKHAHILYNTSNTMKIVFDSNSYSTRPGFAATITEGCGGIMTEPSGLISFNKNSPRDWKCEWSIRLKAGRRIELGFPKFSWPKNDDCTNYIWIKNGLNFSSPNLGQGKYCNRPPTLISTSNNLYFSFNGNPNETVFEATYKEILYDCGKTLLLNEDLSYTIISSPNYPNKSEPFIECDWTVRSPTGTFIQIDFHRNFDFHRTTGCSTEAVEVRDGGTNISPLIGRFCGTSPNTQSSSDNFMFIKFFTEESNPGKGFQANVSLGTCGGTFKDESGEIRKQLDKSLSNNCIWNIIGSPYSTVSISITLDRNGFYCGKNGNLTIYAMNKKFKEEKISDMCDGRTFKKITSIENHVIIKLTDVMKKDIYPYPSSISITYNITTAKCTYSTTADSGVIQSPGYPNLNYIQTLCVWSIKVPEGRRITFNITDFDLEGSFLNFQYSQSLLFFEYERYVITTLYYNSTERIIKSSSNNMQIYFLCEASSNSRGFSAAYSSNEETVCNADFSSDEGRIQRSSAEEKYTCVYKHLQKNLNRTFVLDITFYRQNETNMKKRSSLMVYANSYGKYILGEMLKSVNRPTSRPVTVRTTFSEIFLVIAMKNSEANFTIDYKYYSCGGRLQNASGQIMTPNYPEKYGGRLECAWSIKMPVGNQVKLNFLTMNLGDDCEKSFIIIYNGEYQTAPRIGKFCNTNKPDLIISQKNSLFIEYHHDENSMAVGFNASFETMAKGCGGVYTHKAKFIETPNYPDYYPDNTECRWTIISPEGTHMKLEFAGRFHLEDSDGCKNDYVQIFSWKNNEWTNSGKWCGRSHGTVSSAENKIMIVFKSNDKIQGSGFQAKWEVLCGGVVRASYIKKYLQSPGYPYRYENRQTCRYTIYSSGMVQIEFEDFALEGDYPSCLNDNVTIIATGSPRATYCGETKPVILPSRFSVTIIFKSDSWIKDKGFKLSYKINSGCGEDIKEPKTITLRPAPGQRALPYYGSYVPPKNCLWMITAPKDQIIILKVKEYKSVGYPCFFNSLEIYDAITPNHTKLLASICGNQNDQKPILTTTQNTAAVFLKQQYSESSTLTLDILFAPGPAQGCGGFVNLSKPIVIISPKNFTDIDCQWKFEAPENHRVQFRIDSLKLPAECRDIHQLGSKNCTCSYLEIRDGSGPFSEEIEQFCHDGKNSPQLLETFWKFGFLRFYTSGNSTDAFKVTVSPVIDICGPHEVYATKEVQTITSPGFPHSYNANIKCLWTIRKSSYNHNLVLRFVEFDLTNHTGYVERNRCLGDRVEIDGINREHINKGTGQQIALKEKKPLVYISFATNTGEVLQFCGKEFKPFEIKPDTYHLNVKFISTSEKGKGKGIKMEYFLAGCSSNYTQDYGRIILRTNGTLCSIYITTQVNTTVSLYFTKFWMFGTTCSQNGVEVFDGHATNSPRLVQFCGYTTPPPVFASSNKMLIQIYIRNKSRTTYVNSEANFLSTPPGKQCGGKIFDVSGTISSPFYPNNFTKDVICIWEISVPIGTQVAVSFQGFDISSPCDQNYLKVATFKGNDINERTFCKGDKIALFLSDNRITLRYKSSPGNSGRGWILYFKSIASNYIIPAKRTIPSFKPFPRIRIG